MTTPPDAKPDVMQSLRDLRDGCEGIDGEMEDILTAAIAAWEKERVKWQARHDRIHLELSNRVAEQNEVIAAHKSLVAAVEKVRDEARKDSEPGSYLWELADVLDAALKGKP